MSLITGGTGLEPFSLPIAINGVKHQMIIGPTGSGKSSLLGAMVCAYTGIPNSRIVWLDMDYSSFVLAHLLGADYRDIGALDSPPLNPMSFLYINGGVEWLGRWFERLFKRWNLEISERTFEDFTSILFKAREYEVRNLTAFRALIHGDGNGGERDRIRRILSHYCTFWKHIFNPSGDASANLADSQVSVYEIRALTSYGPQCAAPALELMLQQALFALDGIAPAWVIVDEAWAMLMDPTSAEWFFGETGAIRMLRRRNTGLILSTQSLDEIVHFPMRGLLLESCPGKIFLNNPEAIGTHVAKQYLQLGLNEHEISTISRNAYYYKSIAGSRSFTLPWGRMAKAIFGSTSYQDVDHARRLLREHGNESFRDVWLCAHGLSSVTTSASI